MQFWFSTTEWLKINCAVSDWLLLYLGSSRLFQSWWNLKWFERVFLKIVFIFLVSFQFPSFQYFDASQSIEIFNRCFAFRKMKSALWDPIRFHSWECILQEDSIRVLGAIKVLSITWILFGHGSSYFYRNGYGKFTKGSHHSLFRKHQGTSRVSPIGSFWPGWCIE